MATTVTDRELVGSDIAVHLSEQTTKGAVDAAPAFFKVRRVGGAPKQAKASTTSNELKNNQQGKANIQTSSEQTAEISTEVYQQTKRLVVAALHAIEEDNTISDVDIAATGTGFTIPGHTLEPGDFIFVSGFTDDTINVTYSVTSVAGDDIVTSPAPAATEAAGASVTIASKLYANAKSPTYFTGQRRQLDKSKVGETAYFNFLDGLVDTMSLEIPEEELMTATTNIIFEQALDGRTALPSQTDDPEDTSEAVGVENEFKKFWLNKAPADCTLKSASLEIANNYQTSPAAGCNRRELGGRAFAASGSFVAKSYISNSADWEQQFLDGNRVQLAFEIIWSDGNAMVIDLERAYLNEHEMPTEEGFANNTLNFLLEENPDTNTTIRVFTNF